VKIEKADIVRGGDGLFRTRSGAAADADPAVVIAPGAIESSNVNTVAAMVEMINLARSFELQMKLLQHAEGNEQRATQILGQNG